MKFGDFRRDSGQDWAQLRENAYAYNDDGSLVRVDAEHFFNVRSNSAVLSLPIAISATMMPTMA